MKLKIYCTPDGRRPFVKWLESLKCKQDRYRIKERLDRVALGNLGDFKLLGGGLAELRCHFGPGFRIYYGEEGSDLILLLCAGNKSSQTNDIKKARKYWEDYLRR